MKIVTVAVWLYANSISTTCAFWKVAVPEPERVRFDALVEATNAAVARSEHGFELHVMSWEEAVPHTAQEIADNDMHEFYPGARKGETPTDAVVIDYWNYVNTPSFEGVHGKVPRGGAVTLDEFSGRVRELLPHVAGGRSVLN